MSRSYLDAVQQHLLEGESILWGMGERDTVGAIAAGEDTWRGNELSSVPAALASDTLIPTPPDSGVQMSVISEDAADGVGGAGVREVTIPYLDASGNEATTTVTMNGLTAVQLTVAFVRFAQTMSASVVGSNGVAVGNIRLFKTSDSTIVYNMIRAGENQSTVPHRMVPLGMTCFLGEFVPTESTSNKTCRVKIRADCTNPHAGELSVRQQGVFLFKSLAALDGNGVPVKMVGEVPALCIVKASSWAKTAGADVGLIWWGILKPTAPGS